MNFAGVVTTDTIKIELVDAGKDSAGAKGSIGGKITDLAGLPQGKDVPVELRDDKNMVKDSTKTNEKSEYTFKDVAPGTYTVRSARTGNNTKGATVTQVKEGEKKTDVDVKLEVLIETCHSQRRRRQNLTSFPNSCLGTHLPETPVSRPRGGETGSFQWSAFPNRSLGTRGMMENSFSRELLRAARGARG